MKFKFLLSFCCFGLIFSQQHKQLNPSEIFHEIKKLEVLASVLYLAAHPDDENTKVLSYFANDLKANTAYLSLTRGDGGQNLIGNELRELLGVIRTQELLKARQVDGAQQFFSRANDFGYSKEPTETLNIWDQTTVKEDIAYVVRTFKPDIIINRFNHRTPRTTHGHHTASAMLMVDLFEQVGLTTYFPEQAKSIGTWQPKHLFFNTSWWFYGGREQFQKADKSNLVGINAGKFIRELGASNQEIASKSRSQHQSQGFGSAAQRGDDIEYLELIKGNMPQNKDLFEGIDISWNRVKNGSKIKILVENIIATFQHQNPEASLPKLLEAYQLINQINDYYWKNIKLKDLKNIIHQILCLVAEATTQEPFATHLDQVNLRLEFISRSSTKASIKEAKLLFNEQVILENLALTPNEPYQETISFTVPNNLAFNSPHWLKNNYTEGMYNTNTPESVMPEIPTAMQMQYVVDLNGVPLNFTTPITYKFTDRVRGELYEPFVITPKISLSWAESVTLFADNKPKEVAVNVTSYKDKLTGKLKINYDKTLWSVQPESIEINQLSKQASTTFQFQVSPLKTAVSEFPTLNFEDIYGQNFEHTLQKINYQHIPHQYVMLKAKTKWSSENIKIGKQKIAYIMGAGDEVPNNLSMMGYDVSVVNAADLNETNVKAFDVFITGIRAYNTDRALVQKQALLLEAVSHGKKMIVQYNTSDVLSRNIGPFPFRISRDRVTEEDAPITFLAPNHPVMHQPNQLTTKDFDGWVQERGLYFPDEWDARYTPILAANDKDESPKNGMLLIAKHGKGHFIYTGISFFRQLPAGVEGAYKLMSNLISF